MIKLTPIIFIILIAGLASGARYFVVDDVSPMVLAPNSQADFTVTVQNLGDEGDYARPIFRNPPEGVEIINAPSQGYIFPGGKRTFNATIAAEDIAPGSYSIEIGVFGRGSPPNWRPVSFDLTAPAQPAPITPEPTEAAPDPYEEPSEATNQPQEGGDEGRSVPGFGSALALAALIIASRKIDI